MPGEFTSDLAVVVGISDYAEARSRLDTPARDAEGVSHLLASRFGYEVILRRDSEATLAGLRTLLRDELPERVPADSRLLFYFAGHGVAQDSAELEGPQGYLVPQDATPETGTRLPMRELYEALAALPCRHLLVILDCCFAGSFRWASRRPMYVPDEVLYEERYRHWVHHPARWTLASAAHDEYALDTLDRRRGQAGGRHSPFAAALLEGLAGEADTRPQGGDGIVTLAELYAYVQDRVTPLQSPLLSPLPGQTRGEFVFRDLHRTRPLVSAEKAVRLDASQNPYRTLKAYCAEDAELFFGREDVTHRLLRRVRRNRLTVVVGPSGSGKSSLVQASLLPLLRARRQRRPEVGWRVPEPLRVAGDPYAALHGALAAAGGPPPPSAAELSDNRETVRAWSAAWVASHPCERLLIVVDQAEDLVTRVPPSGAEKPGDLPAASAGFLSCLHTLLEAGVGRLRALMVVRSDYETDLHGGPLASLGSAASFSVPPLSREELRQVIEGPFGRKALYFDDPRLVDLLADEMVGMPGGLPLLSCVLSHLYLAYLRHGRGDRLLTALDLEEIDGKPAVRTDSPVVEGLLRVLREAVNRTVGALPDEAHQETLWRILLRLTDQVGDRMTRRQVSLRELEYPEEQENRRVAEVLARLVDEERLLVRNRAPGASGRLGQGRNALVELAHDKLLEAWPGLKQRIEETRKLLPDHRHLTRAAAAWVTGTGNTRGEPRRRRDLDLRLLRVIEASGLPKDWLSRDETEYLAAARTERRRRTALLWAVTVATLVLIISLVGEAGYHRVNELPLTQPMVAPAGVGFAQDGRSPILLNDRQGLVWNRDSAERPLTIDLPFNVLKSVPARSGEMVVSGLNDVAVVAFPSGRVRWIRHLPGHIEGLAFGAGTVAVSTEEGTLFFFDDSGQRTAAPRPISQAGRRFPVFRETGPFVYGDVLALNKNYLATATMTGRLGILNRRASEFVVASRPQFPLAKPIERVQDPILYETENTRPISALAFMPHDQLLFAEGEGLRRIDLATGQLTALTHCEIELVRQILVLSDEQTIIAFTSSTLEILRFNSADSNRLDCLQRTTLAPKSSPRAALGGDGQTVLIAFFDGKPELWKPGFRIFGVLLPFPRGI